MGASGWWEYGSGGGGVLRLQMQWEPLLPECIQLQQEQRQLRLQQQRCFLEGSLSGGQYGCFESDWQGSFLGVELAEVLAGAAGSGNASPRGLPGGDRHAARLTARLAGRCALVAVQFQGLFSVQKTQQSELRVA